MEKIDISDFRQGLNTEDMAHEIGLSQSPDLQNVDLSQKGKVTTRNGIDNLNTNAIATSTGMHGAFYGKSLHLAATLVDIYKLSSGDYTSIQGSMTSNSETHFIEWNNYVWWTNGAEVPMKYSGSAVTNVGGAPAEWSTDKPEYICEHENRLWTLTAATSQLHWSALSNGEDWTTTDDAGSHSFKPNDGYVGTEIVSQKGGLVVFKEQGIYKVIGKTPVSFSFPDHYKTIGCIAPRSIVNIANRIFFLSKFEGDYAVFVLDDSGGLNMVSKDITPTLATITANSASLACAVSYKGKYRLSFPTSGGWREVCLNYVDGSWEYNTGNAVSCYYKQGDNLYGGSPTTGLVYQLDTGTNDNGSAIISYVYTRNNLMDGADFNKKLRYLVVWVKAYGSYNMRVDIYIDNKLQPTPYYVQLGTKGAKETMRREIIPLNADVKGNMIAIKFGTSTLDQPFELYKAQLYYDIEIPTAF